MPKCTQPPSAAETDDAEARVCADVDTLTNWLTSHCYQAPVQSPPCFWRDQDFDPTEHATPLLLAIVFCPGQRADVVGSAVRELTDRYVKSQAEYVERLLASVDGEGSEL